MFPLDGAVPSAPDHSAGAAADAIRRAEAALVRQNSVTAGVDLQVITAVLNAHVAHSTGAAALEELQREIEAAVATRTDLDTPSGAREFQRYLIDKMHDIRAVVEDTDLDDTSKAALAAALASLYATSGSAEPAPVPARPPEPPRPSATVPAPPEPGPSGQRGRATGGDPAAFDAALETGLDPLLADLSPAADPPTSPTAAAPAPPTGSAPAIPSIPSLGGGLSPLPSPAGLSDLLNAGTPEPGRDPGPADPEADPDPGPDDSGPDEAGPDDLTAPPRPELAGVIAAAVAGAPIADAFAQQGITIPAPGSPVSAPLDVSQVVAGDVGVFADRHALALGNGKVLLDNQIQPIDTVTGPAFIGWQHPPEPPPVQPAD